MTVNVTKLKLLTLVSSVVLLTACNQPSKTEKPTTPVTSSATTSTVTQNTDTHSGHDMSKMDNMTGSSTTNQPGYVSEYMQAMTGMHEQMMSASKITNPDAAFATGMIAHHKGAVEMAKIQLKYGKDSQMRMLAESIIKAQQSEIAQMQDWLNKHKTDKATNATMPEMNMKSQDDMMKGVMSNDPDVAFAKGMIPHHQGAIDMANTEIKMGKDTEMLNLAKKIKLAQDPEIKQMQAWLERKGVK